MLWPFILPIQIICYFLLGVLIVAVVGLRFVKPAWRRNFLWALGLMVLAFSLLFPTLMRNIDAQRFGVFSYAAFNDVQDERVTRYLPSKARDIVVEKQRQGFRAQYKITEAELNIYIDNLWVKYGAQSNVPRSMFDTAKFNNLERHKFEFGDLGWPILSDDAKQYDSPRAGNGAGFFIWFSPSEGIAYERAGYW